MEDNQGTPTGVFNPNEAIKLIHEQFGSIFQQAVWYDSDTKLYYEILRFNQTDNIALFIGPELNASRHTVLTHGGKDEISPCAVDDDHPEAKYHRFQIKRAEHWPRLKSMLPSYLGRAMLCD